ncbi:MAG: hypothetical protein SGCHY_000898 [Lobulomycetales sp.]
MAAKSQYRQPGSNGVHEALERKRKERETHDRLEESHSSRLKQVIQELRALNDSIKNIRKNRVFDDQISPEEAAIIEKRVQLQQLQLQEYEKSEKQRKVNKILSLWDFLTLREIELALEEHEDCEEQTIVAFTDPRYLFSLRKQISVQALGVSHAHNIAKAQNSEQEKRLAYEELVEKRRVRQKKGGTTKTTNPDAKKTASEHQQHNRLRLDDALSQLQGDQMYEGWSAARIRAYQQIESNPNSYYYRFNAPGENQRNGQWTVEEKALFMSRLEEMGATGQWGIFSMAIPGRVGYQCSNYYRGMIKTGKIVDPNYFVDEKGVLHYLFGKKEGGVGVIRKHQKSHSRRVDDSSSGQAVAASSSSASAGKRKRKARRANQSTDKDSENDEDYDASGGGGSESTRPIDQGRRPRTRARGHVIDQDAGLVDNPLPGFIDPISLDQVVRPAISPHGIVMGYDSWVKCLSNPKQKDTCPLTKNPLSRRDLVLLTLDNIEEFRAKIVNI